MRFSISITFYYYLKLIGPVKAANHLFCSFKWLSSFSRKAMRSANLGKFLKMNIRFFKIIYIKSYIPCNKTSFLCNSFCNPWASLHFNVVSNGMCPTIPTVHQLAQSFPIFTEPATPTWEMMIEFSPISTLCPIWIRLSSLQPFMNYCWSKSSPINTVLAPISTSSSMITFPICATFLWTKSACCTKPKTICSQYYAWMYDTITPTCVSRNIKVTEA